MKILLTNVIKKGIIQLGTIHLYLQNLAFKETSVILPLADRLSTGV